MNADEQSFGSDAPCIVARRAGYTIARFEAMGLYADGEVVRERLEQIFRRCRIGVDPHKEPTLVAFRGDRPDEDCLVGGVLARTEREDFASEDAILHSFDVAVDPKHQKGIGFDLLRAAAEDAPQSSLPCRINLWVVNPHVEPILAWMGFEETARHDGGSCHMEKWLPPLQRQTLDGPGAMPATVYHVAPRECRSDIEREGLAVGWELEANVAGVYAWRDLGAAQRCCAEYTRLREAEHEVWEVDALGLPWQDDPQAVGGVVTLGPVAPYRIAACTVEHGAAYLLDEDAAGESLRM